MERESSPTPTVADALAAYEEALREGGDAELQRAWRVLKLARLAAGATADPSHNPHSADRETHWHQRNLDGVPAPPEHSKK
jgi:hypothetical protein